MKDDFCVLKNLKAEVLDVSTLAEFLGVCEMTIYRWTKLRDPIPFHKASGKLLFFKDDVVKWIRTK